MPFPSNVFSITLTMGYGFIFLKKYIRSLPEGHAAFEVALAAVRRGGGDFNKTVYKKRFPAALAAALLDVEFHVPVFGKGFGMGNVAFLGGLAVIMAIHIGSALPVFAPFTTVKV